MAEVKKIGVYELIEPLAGGTHSLFKAKDPQGRVVALKAIELNLATEEQQKRFLREAEIAKSLDHPNLLSLLDSGTDANYLFQVMELLDGADLHRTLARKTAMSWEQRMRIMVQVCDGLAYAHTRGMVHRDLKPANLFLENSGRVRILDFGMARIENSSLTKAGVALGTLNYMAPEQLRGAQCSAASDVFSCGIIFYQLISGQHPFSQGSGALEEIFTKILFQAPKPLRELVPDVPAGIETVINQALEKDPENRPQNASELRGMLRAAAMGSTASPAPSPAAAAVEDLGATRVVRRADMELAKLKAAPPAPPAPSTPAPAPPQVPAPPPAPPTAPGAPQADKRYCPACAMANAKNAVACVHCGSSLMATGTTYPAAKDLGKAAAKPGKLWLIGGAAVVILLVVAYFVIRA